MVKTSPATYQMVNESIIRSHKGQKSYIFYHFIISSLGLAIINDFF